MDRSSSNIVAVDCNTNTKITCYQNRHDSRNVSHCVIIFTRNWRWLRNAVIKVKGYADLDTLVKDWTGCDEFAAIKTSIDARAVALPILLPVTGPSPRRHQRHSCCQLSAKKS